MENLTFNKNKVLDTSTFVRVGDLSNFEGPLLSLFEESKSGHLYLFDWVDRDQKSNRWLIYRVLPQYLLQFLRCEISHLELFEAKPNRIVFFTDIESNNNLFNYFDSFELLSLVPNYYPNNDNFFDKNECNSFEKIKSVILDSLYRQKNENEYSIDYGMEVSKSTEYKAIFFNPIEKIPNPNSFYKSTLKVISLEIQSISQLNNIQNRVFKQHSMLKKQEFKKPKQYANQCS